MLAEFVEKIVSLKENKTHEINGETYSDSILYRVAKYIPEPNPVRFSMLSALVTMIKTEYKKIDGAPIVVHVCGFDNVDVYTSYRDEYTRANLYTAKPSVLMPHSDWMEHEEAIISLKSRYIENEDSLYLLNLLSRINLDQSVSSTDNGVSQTVEARKGISLNAIEKVKPRVTLRPYRTFFEVEQPESEFILRVGDGGAIKIIEADGGMWKKTAVESIKNYFEFELSDLIENGNVIVVG